MNRTTIPIESRSSQLIIFTYVLWIRVAVQNCSLGNKGNLAVGAKGRVEHVALVVAFQLRKVS